MRVPRAQIPPALQLRGSLSRTSGLAQVWRREQSSVTKLSPLWRGKKGLEKKDRFSSLHTSTPQGLPHPPDLEVDATVGATTEGQGEALVGTVDAAREAGTAFHQGALTVPGGRQVGTGVVAGCHTALIGGIGWARQG